MVFPMLSNITLTAFTNICILASWEPETTIDDPLAYNKSFAALDKILSSIDGNPSITWPPVSSAIML